jgi:16S rRNA (guanine527-N7)-methyltransferase
MDVISNEVAIILGIQLSKTHQEAFQVYQNELISWNEKFNLTAIRDPEGIRIKHFLDSLTCLLEMKNPQHQRVIDVGTGAGFPGIPLKIIFPSIELTLVESIGKKAHFCQHVIEVLKLENVQVLTLRAEEVGRLPAHREKYDLALARAVAGLPILAEYLLPLLQMGGKMIAQKGENAPVECQQSEHAFNLLGGKLERLVPVVLPGISENRYLVVVKKIAGTPQDYPRNVGVPSKNPL